MSEPIITLQNVTKQYQVGDSTVYALKDCSLTVQAGEQIAVMGRSGAGKSTLLHLLSGLDLPTAGTVTVCGEQLTSLAPAKRADFRLRHIGYVFQSYNLIPELTLQENICLPALLLNGSVSREFFSEITHALGLESRLHHFPAELSGGQQQRAAIARAVINRPALLLCDEPTGNLDSQTGSEVMMLLTGLADRFQMTLLTVTHDAAVGAQMQRILRIHDGEVQI